jgi:hypothetical protein
MSLSCWKGLKSPALNKSPMMLCAFNGRGFHHHELLQSLAVQLGRKTVTVDVEVVDNPLDYNLLLRIIWFYTMTVVTSSMFQCVQFPHEGKIVTIDQLDVESGPGVKNLLNFQSARNAMKMVPLRPSRLPDSGGIFTFTNGVRMEKISRSVRRAKQAKKMMLTVPVRTVRTTHTWQ